MSRLLPWVVGAALVALRALMDSDAGRCLRSLISEDTVESLLGAGLNRLNQILPSESVSENIPESPTGRRYDAALLFLIYPLELVSRSMADR